MCNGHKPLHGKGAVRAEAELETAEAVTVPERIMDECVTSINLSTERALSGQRRNWNGG